MTKKILKFWQRISFWNKLKGTFASLGIGTEVTLFIGDSNEIWKWVAAICTIASIVITQAIQDTDNDGEVDLFE